MKKLIKILIFYSYTVFLLITLISILAPCFSFFHYNSLSHISYILLRPLCHQMPGRSFFLLGHKMALCARCFALYFSVFLSGLVVFLFRKYFQKYHWKVATGLFIPLILDGLTQFAGLRESNNILRFITGFMCGTGFVLLICPPAFDLCMEDFEIKL